MRLPAHGRSASFRLITPLFAAAASHLRPQARCLPAYATLSGDPPHWISGALPGSSGASLSYFRLASQLAAIEVEPSRLGKESLMRELLSEAWEAGEEPLLACVALTTLQLEPGAKPVKLGMGNAILLDAIARAADPAAGSEADGVAEDKAAATRAKVAAVRLKAGLKALGDLGLLASQELISTRGGPEWAGPKRGAPGGAALWRDGSCGAGGHAAAPVGGPRGALTEEEAAGMVPAVDVLEVLSVMRELAASSGEGSNSRKPQMLARLLGRVSPLEAKMVLRAIAGKLRVGLGDASLRAAIAQAALPRSAAGEAGREHARALDEAIGEDGGAVARALKQTVGFGETGGRAAEDPSRLIALGFLGAKEAEAAEMELRTLAKAAGGKSPVVLRVKRVLALQKEQRKEALALVNAAFQVRPCYHALVRALSRRGVWQLGLSESHPGIPVQSMAAAPAKTVTEVLLRFSSNGQGTAFSEAGPGELRAPFVAELKYDGERCQLHLIPTTAPAAPARATALAMDASTPDASNLDASHLDASTPDSTPAASSSVRIFARSLDETSARFPDVAEALRLTLAPDAAAILDAEVCAYDASARRPLPFQTLAARPRKAPSPEQVAEVPVCVYVFDLLSHNGTCLLSTPLYQRRRLLRQVLRPVEGRVELATGFEGNTAEELQHAFERVTELGAEGLVVKSLDEHASSYEPGKRSLKWLKLKRDYVDGLSDSFDLAPVAAYAGEGRRAGVYGAFLLAARAPGDAERWQPVCKIGSGFSDAELVEFTELFRAAGDAGGGPPPWVDLPGDLPPNYVPDAWLPAPSVVWEVRAAALSLSPIFSAAAGQLGPLDASRGVALRFPRFVRSRPDKPPRLATSAAELAEVFMRQPEYEAALAHQAASKPEDGE